MLLEKILDFITVSMSRAELSLLSPDERTLRRTTQRREAVERWRNKLREQGLPTGRTKLTTSRKARYKRMYNITPEEAQQLLDAQHEQCKICAAPLHLGDETTVATGHVDHCHATGKVRGILCRRCNTGLGLFRDRVDSLHNAINYLKDSK